MADQEPTEDPTEAAPIPFAATTIYGALADRPMVRIVWGTALDTMIAPDVARRIATILLEIAEASEMDATVYRWMRGSVGATVEQSARMMQDFRRIREQLSREQQDG